MVLFTNLMHALAWPLLWWFYDDDISCSMFSYWQNVLHFSENKAVPASDIMLYGSPYSANTILQHLMSCSSYRSYALFTMVNLLVVIYTGKEIAIIEGKNVNTIFVPINIFSYLGLSAYECKMDTFIITAPYLSCSKPWQYAFWWPIKHMKQVTRDPQAVHINLLQHKCTGIPLRKKKQNSSSLGKKPPSIMKMKESHKFTKKLILSTQSQTDVTDVVTPSTEKVLNVQ